MDHERAHHLMRTIQMLNDVHPNLHHIRNHAMKELEKINAELADKELPVSSVQVPGEVNEAQVAAAHEEDSTTIGADAKGNAPTGPTVYPTGSQGGTLPPKSDGPTQTDKVALAEPGRETAKPEPTPATATPTVADIPRRI